MDVKSHRKWAKEYPKVKGVVGDFIEALNLSEKCLQGVVTQ